MKILLMQNEEYESGFKILRREESNFYTKHFEELCEGEVSVTQKLKRKTMRPKLLKKHEKIQRRALTPETNSKPLSRLKMKQERFTARDTRPLRKMIPRPTKQIINPISQRMETNKPNKSKVKLISTNAWCDIRFQNFYKFSNKNRDEQTVLDELFINPNPDFYDTEVDTQWRKGNRNQFVDCSKLDLTSTASKTKKMKPVQINTSFSTEKYWVKFTNDFYKGFKLLALVNDKKLVFLRSLNDLKPVIVIDFDIINPDLMASSEMKKNLMLALTIKEARYQILIEFFTENSFKKFLSMIRARKMKHKKRIWIKFSKDKNFFKKFYLNENEFLHTVNSGDLLLFKSKGIGSSIQRGILGSRFDHIAVAIRSCTKKAKEKHTILIFEAIGGTGVQLLSWGTFKSKRWQNLYDRVILRKINVDRTPSFLDKVQDFISENVGKEYSILKNPFKKSKESGYFCSELVGYLFKTLGLLKEGVNPSTLLPVNFDGVNLESILKVKLSFEYTIKFNSLS